MRNLSKLEYINDIKTMALMLTGAVGMTYDLEFERFLSNSPATISNRYNKDELYVMFNSFYSECLIAGLFE